jgi:hypothetical protein
MHREKRSWLPMGGEEPPEPGARLEARLHGAVRRMKFP